jgi:hypothetical protein
MTLCHRMPAFEKVVRRSAAEVLLSFGARQYHAHFIGRVAGILVLSLHQSLKRERRT